MPQRARFAYFHPEGELESESSHRGAARAEATHQPRGGPWKDFIYGASSKGTTGRLRGATASPGGRGGRRGRRAGASATGAKRPQSPPPPHTRARARWLSCYQDDWEAAFRDQQAFATLLANRTRDALGEAVADVGTEAEFGSGFCFTYNQVRT